MLMHVPKVLRVDCTNVLTRVLCAADSSTEITQQPQPTEDEIQFILDAISKYLIVDVRRSDVQSAWSGIRPLAQDPHARDTASASRDHIVTTDPDGVITVTGVVLSQQLGKDFCCASLGICQLT